MLREIGAEEVVEAVRGTERGRPRNKGGEKEVGGGGKGWTGWLVLESSSGR